jgi:EAL domain-containing protein (putative c-di-GMP-specific phosphodiesterase class I)
MKNADTALNRAKEKGTNNYEFYRKDMNDNALEKVVFETDLRRAMEKEEFFLVFQPQLELKEGSITGVEALLRWKHDVLGIISPAQFIPLAEETGLIVPIGRWVLDEACKQLKRWHNSGFDKLTVAVNVSAKQFEKSDIVDTVYSVLQKNNLDPKYLQLELTENIVMKNRDRFLHTFHEFRKLGINVAIDDFGTGFSSLSYLKKFDVNQLKIDKSFVKEICMDYRDEAITAAIISMAHSLNLDVLAEGVETEEQLLVLKNQNCDKIQGYYFSRPEKAEEIEKMLREDRRL